MLHVRIQIHIWKKKCFFISHSFGRIVKNIEVFKNYDGASDEQANEATKQKIWETKLDIEWMEEWISETASPKTKHLNLYP